MFIQLNYILPINCFYLIKHNKVNTNKTNCYQFENNLLSISNQFENLENQNLELR
jgi:hypothetical protein